MALSQLLIDLADLVLAITRQQARADGALMAEALVETLKTT